MAHIIKEKKVEDMYDIAIYAIVSPFEDKKIYVSRTGQNRVRKTYTEHIKLRVNKTKDLFMRAAEENVLPPIYILEFSCITKREAFRRCVAWTRYFLDHGYAQTTQDCIGEYANNLTDITLSHYNKIKDEPISEVLQPAGGLFPEYGKRRNENTETVISVRFDPAEYPIVKEKAEALGLSLGAYCKKMTLNGRVLQPDLSFLGDYVNDFTEIKKLLRQILFTNYTTGKYYPADIKNIQNCIEQVTAIQKEAYDQLEKVVRAFRE